MKLLIQLEGAGWAVARLSDGDKALEMSVSYLSNGIGDLVNATVSLLNGAQSANFSFQEEPGQYFWSLTREQNEQLRVEVFWSEKSFSASKGNLAFVTQCKIQNFITQVYLNLKSLKSEEPHYKERWRHDFPEEAFRKLSAWKRVNNERNEAA